MTDTLTPVLTANWDQPDSFTLDGYKRGGGWQALPKALAMDPDDLITALKNANLRGRGGAGFPTGVKWSFLPQGDTKPHFLVVNADESEPGACKDVPLMMASPHLLIEGAAGRLSRHAVDQQRDQARARERGENRQQQAFGCGRAHGHSNGRGIA